MNILYYGIAYSVFLLFSSLTLAQNNILQIYRSDTIFSLNPFLTYIEDKEKNYTFEQISSPQGQRNFQPLPKGKANFGYSNSAYWFKFSIQPQVRENTSWLVEFAYPILDEILFFAPDLTKNTQKLTWKKYVLGDKYPFAQRPIKYKNFTIPIDFPANSGNQIYTFYFRIDTQSSTQADLQLVPAKMFFDLKMPEQMLYGHFFGILLVMFCYNFLIFFSLNDRLYLYYCLLILSNGILFGSLSGHFFEYVLPNSPYWANKAVLLSMNLSVVFLQLFTNHFLDLAKYLPLMHKLQKLWAGIAGVFCGLAFLLSYSLVGRLGLLIVILAIASNLVSGVWVWYKGNKSARFFLLAFSSFLLAVIVLIFRNLTLLPTNIFTSHAVEIGNALQVTLFSLALGDRYRLYKKQKEEAQAEALRIQLEANEQLERKVEERTRKLKEMTEELQMLNEELNSTNEELVTNIELVQTQSQKLREVNQLLQEWQKNMQDSIAYALQIQTAMLQFDTKNLQYFHSYFILWLPRDVVSGDFYYIRQIEHQIFVAAVDCTGHGVPGAFMSVLGINLLDEIIINQQHYEPQNILLHLHTRIQRALRQQQTNNRDGMDLALIRLDTHTHEITYAGAKNPLLIIHNQEAIYLKPDRFSIGGDSIKQNLVFQQQTLSLQKGMRLFLFSDGLADQFGGEENKKFTFANLKQLLLTTSNYPLEEQKQKILHSFTSWKADYPQTDDVLLIGLEV